MKSNYHLKNKSVEARRHDGSDESAIELTRWVRECKGDAYTILKGEADLEGYLGDAFVILRGSDGKIHSVIRPNFWIIQCEPGVFYGCYPDIFRRLYKPVKEKEHGEAVPAVA